MAKTIKISLMILIVALLMTFVFIWFVKIPPPPPVTPPTNQFIERIQNATDSLKNISGSDFSRQWYNDITYMIEDYYKQQFLGISYSVDGTEVVNSSNNNKWRDILSKNIYSVYAEKFIQKAYGIFKRSEWSAPELGFIRDELKFLESSANLSSDGSVRGEFNEIKLILAKHDEITTFISECNGYNFTDLSLTAQFPDVSDKVGKSKVYISNGLGHYYLRNCTRLKTGLQEIPERLFNKHVNYLYLKIQEHGRRYSKFQYQSDFSRLIYSPLRAQVDSLDNEAYRVGDSVFNKGYTKLDNLLGDYNLEAINYFLNLKKN